jgi:hypothetical protein
MMVSKMERRVFRSLGSSSTVRRCPLSAILCVLLILWAAIDSQVLLLASAASLSASSPNPSPSQDDDDDDYVLDLTGKSTLGSSVRRNASPPSSKRQRQIACASSCFARSSHRQSAPSTPLCEQAFRNGIGAPLLC